MNCEEVIRRISESLDLKKKDVSDTIYSFFSILRKEAKRGEDISISEFGRFYPEFKPPRKCNSNLPSVDSSTMTAGRIYIKFKHYKRSAEDMYNNSPFPEVFQEKENVD